MESSIPAPHVHLEEGAARHPSLLQHLETLVGFSTSPTPVCGVAGPVALVDMLWRRETWGPSPLMTQREHQPQKTGLQESVLVAN